MDFDFQQNHFRLFGVEPRYALDLARIDQRYRDLQAQVHPDRHAHAGDAERRLSMQWATHVNEAYQTLRKPLDRARYLLALNGVSTGEDSNTAMPAEFLLQQMEWREGIADARQTGDIDALEHLLTRLRQETDSLQARLADALDARADYPAAAGLVRMLKFMDKLREEIGHALETLEI